MNNELKKFLANGYTPYQSTALAAQMLEKSGFTKTDVFSSLENGDKLYKSEDGALIAVSVGSPTGFMIVGSHTDSPALKLKRGLLSGGRLNVEVYGGAINYTLFDTPLKICGRIYVDDGKKIAAKNVVSDYRVTIPSLAVHLNRGVNGGFAPSAQNDLAPLIGEHPDFLEKLAGKDKPVDYDLYACPDVDPYECGADGEYLCSPRIDNLVSVFSSVKAIAAAKPVGINICVCFDGEETGSRIRRGAAAAFFPKLLEEIFFAAGGKNFAQALRNSFMLSADNAHATHPAHPEKSDPVNKVELGGGIVIKHHPNYATDGLGAATAKKIFSDAGVPYQDFYSNSDAPCGSTIGLITAAASDIRTCDIGVPQLAMHSAVETCKASDIDAMTKGLTAFFSSSVRFYGDGAKIS